MTMFVSAHTVRRIRRRPVLDDALLLHLSHFGQPHDLILRQKTGRDIDHAIIRAEVARRRSQPTGAREQAVNREARSRAAAQQAGRRGRGRQKRADQSEQGPARGLGRPDSRAVSVPRLSIRRPDRSVTGGVAARIWKALPADSFVRSIPIGGFRSGFRSAACRCLSARSASRHAARPPCVAALHPVL
jgi:hypothetical protein